MNLVGQIRGALGAAWGSHCVALEGFSCSSANNKEGPQGPHEGHLQEPLQEVLAGRARLARRAEMAGSTTCFICVCVCVCVLKNVF